MKLSRHFTLEEFTRSHTAARRNLPNIPGPEAIQRMIALCENVLEPLREEVGVPIHVTSGYRSPEVNARIGGSNRSQHPKGEASDIVIPGLTPLEVCKLIVRMRLPYDQLIFEFGRWTHVSHVAGTPRAMTLTAVSTAVGVKYLKGLQEVA